VKHIVKLSVVGAAHDAPAQLMRWHAQCERLLEQSGVAWTHLRPHVFYQYWLQLVYPINMTGGFYASLDADVPLPAIDIRDIATAAVRCLIEPGHEGKVYRLTGPEALTNTQVAEKIGKVMGKPVTYSYMPPEQTKAGMAQLGMAPWFVDFVVGMDEAYSTGNYSEVTHDFYKLTGRQPISADRFFYDFGDFIRNPPQFDMSAMGGGEPEINPEELKVKVIRLYDQLNRNNMDVLYEVMDPHFTAHGETMGLDPSDKDHLAAVARGIQWAKFVFPDLYVSVDEVIAEGNMVVARLRWRGTVSQEVYGVPPNGQTIEWTGIAINRFEDGKIVERWFNSDELGMMRGMGLLPSMDGGGAPAEASEEQAPADVAAAPAADGGNSWTQPAGETAPADVSNGQAPAVSQTAPAASTSNGQAPAATLQTSVATAAPAGSPVSEEQLERNKQLVRKFYDRYFTDGRDGGLKDVLADDFVDNAEALFSTSPNGSSNGAGSLSQTIPMKMVHIDEMVAEGDLVGVRASMTGLHLVDWLGRPASGNELNWVDLSIFRIKDGKIVERFISPDSLFILEQMGYWPVKS
jgi:predicted ester cyclase